MSPVLAWVTMHDSDVTHSRSAVGSKNVSESNRWARYAAPATGADAPLRSQSGARRDKVAAAAPITRKARKP